MITSLRSSRSREANRLRAVSQRSPPFRQEKGFRVESLGFRVVGFEGWSVLLGGLRFGVLWGGFAFVKQARED